MSEQKSLIYEINKLEKQLITEVQKKGRGVFLQGKGGKVFFELETQKYPKALVTKLCQYLLHFRL